MNKEEIKKDKVTELKEIAEGWKTSIQIRQIAYQEAKKILREWEEKLKQCKKIVNLTYNELKDAKHNFETSVHRVSSYNSKNRRWAKENMNSVWELMEK